MSCFDKTTKIRFKDDKDPQYIKFGSTRDNDANYNVRFGQLKLNGCASFSQVVSEIRHRYRADVAKFYKPSVDCIVKSVLAMRDAAHCTITVSREKSNHRSAMC